MYYADGIEIVAALIAGEHNCGLIDNFSGKNIVWGHGGVRHFAIEIVDA
jgi:hypothetical protein